MAFWWGAAVDCAATLLAAQRRERLTSGDVQRARGIFDHLRVRAFEVQPSDEVRARALRLLSRHELTPPAALELAAALVWRQENDLEARIPRAEFVSLQPSLRLAASLEGFRVLPYSDEVHAPAPFP